jgi:hypothetical protein
MPKPSPVKIAAVQLLTLAGLGVAAFVAYAVLASQHGRGHAQALCDAVPVGTSAEAATQAVQDADTTPRLRWVKGGTFGAGFHGAFTERWVCNLSVKDGVVVAQEVRVVD